MIVSPTNAPAPPTIAIKRGLCVCASSNITEVAIATENVEENKIPEIKVIRKKYIPGGSKRKSLKGPILWIEMAISNEVKITSPSRINFLRLTLASSTI